MHSPQTSQHEALAVVAVATGCGAVCVHWAYRRIVGANISVVEQQVARIPQQIVSLLVVKDGLRAGLSLVVSPAPVLPFAVHQLKEGTMDQKTYTTRHNARRAGVQAGIPTERVVITVHKQGDEVRFGFADGDADRGSFQGVAPPELPILPPPSVAAERPLTGRAAAEVRNGVRRPAPGGVCRAVWDWLDAHPSVSAKDARGAASAHGWNENNVSCEYYAWRKFHGIVGSRARCARSAGAAVNEGTASV